MADKSSGSKCKSETMSISRRGFAAMCSASILGVATPSFGFNRPDDYIRWSNLQKAGLPEPRIINEGFIDVPNDIWKPIYDSIGSTINEDVTRRTISIAGFILPLSDTRNQSKDCILIPNRSACLHFPPPPPNQAVYVKFHETLDVGRYAEPVLLSGHLIAEETDTNILKAGYVLECSALGPYY